MKQRKQSDDLLPAIAAFAKAVRDMPEDQYNELVNGVPSFLPSPKKRGSAEKRASKENNGRSEPILESQKRDAVELELNSASTREDGARIVQESFSRKDELFAFAKFLDLPVQKRDNMDRIRRKIVEFTVGRRLDSAAIRGGYAVK